MRKLSPRNGSGVLQGSHLRVRPGSSWTSPKDAAWSAPRGLPALPDSLFLEFSMLWMHDTDLVCPPPTSLASPFSVPCSGPSSHPFQADVSQGPIPGLWLFSLHVHYQYHRFHLLVCFQPPSLYECQPDLYAQAKTSNCQSSRSIWMSLSSQSLYPRLATSCLLSTPGWHPCRRAHWT